MIIFNNILVSVDKSDIKNGNFTIPDSVTSIGNYAFYGCTSLTSVTIGGSVTSIGNYAFYGCTSLNDVYYTGTIDQWAQISFDDYYANPLCCAHNLYIDNQLVTDIVLTTATKISAYAFYNCTSLTSITIRDSVTSIGSWALEYCSKLTNIDVSSGNAVYKSIDGNLYSKDGTVLIQYAAGKTDTSFIVPDSVTSIGNYAFYNCTSLTKYANYKAFRLEKSGRLKCNGKTYKENHWSFVKGDLQLCENGIHYCTNLFEIFNYYCGEIDKDIAIYECEVRGEIITSDTSKCCCRKLKPAKRLYRKDIIKILNGEVIK